MGTLNAGTTPPLIEIVGKVKPTLRGQETWTIKVDQDPRRSPAATAEAIDRAFDAMRDKVKELVP
jgi:hypothetical protein